MDDIVSLMDTPAVPMPTMRMLKVPNVDKAGSQPCMQCCAVKHTFNETTFRYGRKLFLKPMHGIGVALWPGYLRSTRATHAVVVIRK